MVLQRDHYGQVKHARTRLEEAELEKLEEDIKSENDGTLAPPPHWLPVVQIQETSADHIEPSLLQVKGRDEGEDIIERRRT